MYLAIDSNLNGYSASLVKNNELIFEFEKEAAKSQNLIIDLKEEFLKYDLKVHDIQVVLVNIGPGSFTGIRTALTIANALKANLDIKLIPINNFQILRFLNPASLKIAFRASSKNPNEFFVSLDENYQDTQSNYFSTEISDDFDLLELPNALQRTQVMLEFIKDKNINLLAQEDIQPYYLREPSLRLAKANA
jgi:tRNA A37 threonylcarbamoyladenosine modification protein TsaB